MAGLGGQGDGALGDGQLAVGHLEGDLGEVAVGVLELVGGQAHPVGVGVGARGLGLAGELDGGAHVVEVAAGLDVVAGDGVLLAVVGGAGLVAGDRHDDLVGGLVDPELALGLGDVVVGALELVALGEGDGVGHLALGHVGDAARGLDVAGLAGDEAVAAHGDVGLGERGAVVGLVAGLGGQGDGARVHLEAAGLDVFIQQISNVIAVIGNQKIIAFSGNSAVVNIFNTCFRGSGNIASIDWGNVHSRIVAFAVVLTAIVQHVARDGLVLVVDLQGQRVIRVGTHSSGQYTLGSIDLEQIRIALVTDKHVLGVVRGRINICSAGRARSIDGANLLRVRLVGTFNINLYVVGIAFLAWVIAEVGLENNLVAAFILVEGLLGLGDRDNASSVVRCLTVLPVKEVLAILRRLVNALSNFKRGFFAYVHALNIIAIGVLVHSPDIALIGLALNDKAKILALVGSRNGEGVIVGCTVLGDGL